MSADPVTEALTITGLGRRGEGIAEHRGQRLFVPRALPGERVLAEIEGERAMPVRIDTASPDRIAPFCPHYGACGGCQLQHMAPDAYAAFKRRLVETALAQAGIAAAVEPLVDAWGSGRRRVTFHVRKDRAGFMGFRSHDLVDLDACPILVPQLKRGPAVARTLGKLLGDCEVALTASAAGIDAHVRGSKRKPRPEALAALGTQLRLARIAIEGEVLFQAMVPTVRIGKAEVDLPVGSFLQATAEAEETLARLVVAGIGKAKAVADLFCGIGPFALRLAENAKVLAADADKGAMAALDKAVRNTQGLKAVTVRRRDLFRDPLAPAELEGLDGVVVDPPRAGAEAQAREIGRSTLKRLVYVSCDPGSFARDARLLTDAGFRVVKVTPVDQFAYSSHVEVVGVFER